MNERTIAAFHDEYYLAMPDTWEKVFYKGVPVRKNPMDLWIYQEILWENEPDFIIETGTAYGGSALWFAHMATHAYVITIDIMDQEYFPNRPHHERITYVTGDTSQPTTVAHVKGIMQVLERAHLIDDPRVMVVLDSEHTQDHVRAELEIWPRLVTADQYLVVEDTNITPQLAPQYQNGGPKEALDDWHRFYKDEFEVDLDRQRHGLTFNPGGWLKRVK